MTLVTDVNCTYGEHFIMHLIVESLHCTYETNIVCQL